MTEPATPDVSAQLLRAVSSLKEMRTRLAAAEAARHEPIAIVGMGCRFPGAADPQAFWQLLRDGGDAITETPAARWSLDAYYDAVPETAGKVATRWGGYLDDIEGFDHAFFGISPREADQMDPQQRLLLEVTWEALEDAGQSVAALAGSDTGVFVGVHSHSEDYYLLQAIDPASLDLYSGTGTSHAVLSGRLSYLFDFRGPSFAIDAACSSSLVAVHLAVQSLRNRECSLAVAGGVNSIIDPTFTMVASRMRMMSPRGRCRPFDAGADGFVRSEGCGAVVLKRLADAVADGDRVLAVVHGSAINQDGRSNGLTAPNSASQQSVIAAALADAGVQAADIDVVEAHGTGTPIGDPIEVEALSAVFAGVADRTVALGSVKSNIGHTEGAAGVAGLIKMVLSLRAGEVAPLVHFTSLNPHIRLDGTPFVLPTTPMPWPRHGDRRLAGISSFGLSGTNAHVVIGEAPAGAPAPVGAPGDPVLLPISGRSPEALAALTARYRDMLGSGVEAAAVAATAARRRSHHDHRLAIAGRTNADLVEALDAHLAGHEHVAVAAGIDRHDAALTTFVFPGQGAQWTGMATRLLTEDETFRQAIERCDAAFRPFVDWSLLDVLADPDPERLDPIDVVQPVLFAMQVALAAVWQRWGVVPDAVVGHSMGEVAAAHVAGVLTLDDAARVICVRSRLLRTIAGRGAMAVVGLDADAAQAAIAAHEHDLSVAARNSPTSTVLAGDAAALDRVLADLTEQGVFGRRVKVDVASHSPQVEGLLADLRAELAPIRPRPGHVPFMSTVTASALDGTALDAEYWCRNVREPVLLADAVGGLVDGGHARFVELSPHPLLAGAVREALDGAGRPGLAVSSMARDADAGVGLRAALGALYAAGHPVDWSRSQPAAPPADLPAYPWQRERHWLGAHDDDGIDELIHQMSWRSAALPDTPRGGIGRWLVVAGDGVDAAPYAAALHAGVMPLSDDVAAQIGAALDAGAAHGPADERVGIVVIARSITDGASIAEIGERQCRQVGAVLALAAALDRERRPTTLWLATHAAQFVAAGDRVDGHADGTLWGLGRSIGEELPHLWGGCVDLPGGAEPAVAAAVLADELQHVVSGEPDEGEVAWRDGQRFVAWLTAVHTDPAERLALAADHSVLITGGFGAVGRHLARWLIGEGARRLVLLGRTELPPRRTWAGLDPDTPPGRRVALVRELEALGAAVHVAAVDVADAAALTAFLDGFRDEGWPPIRAVSHAAAQFGGELIGDVGPAEVRAQVLPKLVGASVFHARPEVDTLVLFSSIAGSLPMAGQSAYAAGNGFLDSLAQHRAALGLPAVSIAWGFWEGSDEAEAGETGRGHADGTGRSFKEIANTLAVDQGIEGFDRTQGLTAMRRIVTGRITNSVVASIDWARLGSARIASVAGLASDRVRMAPGGASRRHTLADEVAAAAPRDRRALIEAAVRRVVGSVLKLPPERIDGAAPFGALGLDSLMSVELRNRLERELGFKVSATVAWNYPTVADLAGFVLERLDGDSPASAHSEPAAGPTAAIGALAAQVGNLSDDEALAALLGGDR